MNIQDFVRSLQQDETYPKLFVGKYSLRRYKAVLRYYICTKPTGESNVLITYDSWFVVRYKMTHMGYNWHLKEVCRSRYLAEQRKRTNALNPLLPWVKRPTLQLRSTHVN
jgi:hypothetical protein